MMGSMIGMLLPLMALGGPEDVVSFSARIDAEEVKRGGKYEIVLEVSFKDGQSASDAGVPAPILQIDVPKSVRLSGKVLRSYRQQAENEFLQAPFERLIEEPTTRIGFRMTKTPARTDRVFLNLLAYVRGTDGEFFIRRRLELALEAGAEGKPVSAAASSWGGDDMLQIGDEAPDFTLPKADGSKVTLSDFRGKKSVIVTTYRAFW